MKCQFYDLFTDAFGELEYTAMEGLWYKIKKIPILGCIGMFFLKGSREAVKQGRLFIRRMKMKSRRGKEGKAAFKDEPVLNLEKGEIVKVRSRREIEQTLDENNQFQGVEFMETMWQFCDGTYEVMKRLERILDPWENRLRKCRNMVILKGLFCHGDPAHNLDCDRTCLYYWKEAWLERVSPGSRSDQ